MARRLYQSDGAVTVEPVLVDSAGVEIPGAQLNRKLPPSLTSFTIEELDGSPSSACTKLVLPNGTLTIVGGVATYTPTASGGGTPSVNNQSAAYQFVAADYTGLVTVRHPPADVTARIWTIPANATVANVPGVIIPLRVGPLAGAITLTPAGGVTLYAAGNSTTGSRTLAAGAECALHCEATDLWVLSGTGWT